MTTLCYPPSVPVRSAVPTFEPITLDEARKQCGIASSIDFHDEEFTRLIKESREKVEKDALLICCTGTYTFKRTDWGNKEWWELPSELRPVTAIGSIAYINSGGTSTTWSSLEYSLDTYSIVPLVRLNYGYSWPSLRGDHNGITVTATVGYATAGVIPERIKAAVKLWLWIRFEESMDSGKDLRVAVQRYESLIEGLRREVYA